MRRVSVHRNPDCARCARYARLHRRLDWLHRVAISTESPFDRPMRMGEVVVADLREGSVLEGADGIELLVRQVPAYWPVLPLLRLPAVRRAVDREVAGDCDGACAID